MEGTVVGSCDRSFKDPSRRYHQSKKKKSCLLVLSYILLTITFLIGRRRTVNFRNQRLVRHLAAV